jgi:hypothetical protein
MLQSDTAKGLTPQANPCNAGEMVAHRAVFAITAAQLTLNQIIEMAALPADNTLIDVILDTTDLDTGTAAITLDVGIMSGTYGVSDGTRTCGAEIFSAVTTAQAGGVARPTLASAFGIARSHEDRGIGIKIKAAPDTAAAGTIGLTLIYAG